MHDIEHIPRDTERTPRDAASALGTSAPDAAPRAAARTPRDADGLVPLDLWSRSFDRLYRKTDKLYYLLSRDCGLSESAYWLMYAIYTCGGQTPVRTLVDECLYSKQTVNSALRALESRGLVEMSFCEGSRKAKQVSFTEAGRALATERIVPANLAERRAFAALAPEEQEEMLYLVDKYVGAVEVQIDLMEGRGRSDAD